MNAVLKIITALPALVFVCVGLSWWIAPEFAGTIFGMELLTGAGLSTQIADFAAFFLLLGTTILIGLFSRHRMWLYPPLMLLSFAIVGRLIAWFFHEAALTLESMALEAFVIALLFLNLIKKPPA